jgi:hypothetical protein
MVTGGVLQPCRLGCLDFGLGLRGTSPRLDLGGRGFAFLDMLGLLRDLLAQLLGLRAPALVSRAAGEKCHQRENDDGRHHRDDDPDNSVAVHVGSFGRSVRCVIDEPANSADALPRHHLNRNAAPNMLSGVA